MMNTILEVNRTDCGQTRITESETTPLEPGQVRFRVNHVAVTANNVTYAVMGDLFGYWDFFPTETGWGRVPAMGWAEIIESNHPDVAVGGRYYGWYPMATTTAMTVSVRRDGLRDEGPHRKDHAPIYRSYLRTDLDGLWDPAFAEEGSDAEYRHSLLRGLFVTAFLADAFFAEPTDRDGQMLEPYFGTDRVVVSSASSKTAIGFAQRAHERGIWVAGLTSSDNVDFVESLGFYDEVVAYPDLETLPTAPAVSIDMAGDAGVLARVHAHLGDQLRYSMTVGKSHHDSAPAKVTAGPTPQLFFAPTEVTRRIEAWGPAEFRRRVDEATQSFVAASEAWLSIEVSDGPEGAAETWAAVYGGRIAPHVGRIVSL